MMLFKPQLIDAIQAGRKVVTRRPCVTGSTVLRYKPKQWYAIQPGRGKRHVGHIRVTSAYIDTEGITDFRDHMARDEGFADAAEFLAYWRMLWPKLPETTPVAVYRFVYEGTLDCCTHSDTPHDGEGV